MSIRESSPDSSPGVEKPPGAGTEKDNFGKPPPDVEKPPGADTEKDNFGKPPPDVEKPPGAGTEKSDQVPDSSSASSSDFQGFDSSSRGSEPSSEGVNRDSDFQGIESNQTSSSDTSEQTEPASTSW
jgi:hypothetical protein